MAIILFFIVLMVLVIVHEIGHFVVAKFFGIRVDEFGIGFPPRIWGFKKGETEYTVNWIPFGGFVKIFGENPDDESIKGADSSRSMVHKPKYAQVAVLAAGVTFNIIFAWLLFTIGFMVGMPGSASQFGEARVYNERLVVTSVIPGSPAANAGLQPGDEIIGLTAANKVHATTTSVADVRTFFSTHGAQAVTIIYKRASQEKTTFAEPTTGLIKDESQAFAIGVGLDQVGTVRLPVHLAIWEGLKFTFDWLVQIVVGLATFIKNIFMFNADLSAVTGPVGIVGLVGDASRLGFIYLLSFTAFISLNLAVINLLPLPALDGGRILFVFIEALKGSPIKPSIANMVNTIGFLALLALMFVVTIHDVIKLIWS